ncbi:Hypothetical predicted protein [Mytilus galloprovincialis]|uniref:Uncharacterized protein n=1 Tax=Mytilus galloprovincialis TaxID=29158 RepID=A0A8B6C387_MYTGA|nr:Hypothetical predicted protein [Mytilus galloprovincialis]
MDLEIKKAFYINECSSNNGIGPCHQTCQDLTPGYTCGCIAGFVLYTAEGISNISLADGEDGETEGDVYHINHTCVRKQCAVPPPLTNGKVLSKKELFFFEDSVEFTLATCPTPTTGSIARSTNIYPSGSTVDYNKEVNIECQYGSMKINRTLYCSYNVMSGRYELLGDAPECPEIDCGPPEEVPGSMYSGLTNTNLDSTFTFDCKSGFERSGMLMDGTYTVRCQDNGRWNIGNLTCTGGRCKDPGTPGGAMQVVTSYEVGQMVYFKCNNSGYFPEPPQPLECVVDTNAGNITWNATVEDGSADLPECLDKTPPVFSNCPSDLIYVDKTEEYTYPMLTATDNSGAVKNIRNPGGYRPSGLRTNSDFDITYTAEDFSGNTADCVIKIRVKDYARHQLTCPQNKTIYIGTETGAVFNVSDVVSVTPSDSDLTFMFSPGELITLDYTAMVEQKKVVVTATDKWGAEDQCSFLVETKADACFRESFPVSVPNAAPVTCTSSNISCTVTCNNGYVFFDGNTTKTYDCTGQNMWMPALPPDTCIKYDEPSNIIVLQVAYKSTVQGKFAKDCKAGHDDKIRANNASLTNDIYNICNIANLVSVGPVVITNTQSSTTGFDFRTIFTIRLASTDPENIKQIPACLGLLGLQFDKDSFLDYTGSVQCNSGTTTVVRLTSDSSNQVISSGNQCDNGIKKMTTVDSSSKCNNNRQWAIIGGLISCVSIIVIICVVIWRNTRCSNRFKDALPCIKNTTESDYETALKEIRQEPISLHSAVDEKTVCPAGFISVDGLPTCMPCPENHHWVNKTYCEPCPNSGSTLGKDAIPDVNGCKAPCNMGEYSVTGYAPCKKCPVNFYQDQTTQEMCKPCGNDSITQRSGSNDSSFCIQLGSDSSPGGILCCEICAGRLHCI